MKILAANKKDWTHPSSGGAEIHLRETLSRLADRGHEVHLLTSKYRGSPSTERLNGVKIHRRGIKGFLSELYILGVGQLHLNKLILELNPDVVYTTNSVMGWIPLFKRNKLVTCIHHLNEEDILKQLRFPFNFLGYIAEKFSLKLAERNKTLTVSPQIARKLTSKGLKEEKTRVITNGVDSSKYLPSEESKEPQVLYLGRLEHTKGANLLPEIHKRIKDSFGEYEMEIAGSGRKEKAVQNLAEENDEVTYHGYVDEEKKKELLSSSWLIIAPSRREGWSLVVMEGAASGTPTVAFNTEGLNSSVRDGETGKLVPLTSSKSQSIERFANAVSELLRKDQKRRELGNKARKAAEEYQWEKTTEELEKVLEDVNREKT